MILFIFFDGFPLVCETVKIKGNEFRQSKTFTPLELFNPRKWHQNIGGLIDFEIDNSNNFQSLYTAKSFLTEKLYWSAYKYINGATLPVSQLIIRDIVRVNLECTQHFLLHISSCFQSNASWSRKSQIVKMNYNVLLVILIKKHSWKKSFSLLFRLTKKGPKQPYCVCQGRFT